MADLTYLLKRLADQRPELADNVQRTLEAIELIELREPIAVLGEELVKRIPAAKKFTFSNSGRYPSIEVYVDGEPIHVVHHYGKGFIRYDFSISVPLGDDVEKAVKAFDRMLKTPFEALRRRYGSGPYTHHNTQMRCLVDHYEEENAEECADDEKLRNAFGPDRVAAMDPNEQAYDLVKDWKGLERALTGKVQDIAKALKAAERQVDSLESVGSHYLSAPSVLAADPLKKLNSLSLFVDNVISQVRDLSRHGR